MTRKTQQKTRKNGREKAGNVYPKVNRANSTVNKANAQSRPSGILCALAHGKLYFAKYKIGFLPIELQGFRKRKRTMGNDIETSERLRSAFFFHCFK